MYFYNIKVTTKLGTAYSFTYVPHVHITIYVTFWTKKASTLYTFMVIIYCWYNVHESILI